MSKALKPIESLTAAQRKNYKLVRHDEANGQIEIFTGVNARRLRQKTGANPKTLERHVWSENGKTQERYFLVMDLDASLGKGTGNPLGGTGKSRSTGPEFMGYRLSNFVAWLGANGVVTKEAMPLFVALKADLDSFGLKPHAHKWISDHLWYGRRDKIRPADVSMKDEERIEKLLVKVRANLAKEATAKASAKKPAAKKVAKKPAAKKTAKKPAAKKTAKKRAAKKTAKK